jgi:uncharacterized protein (TIGR00304 family)
MNKYHFLSFVCFIIGIAFFVLGFLQGDIQTGIFVIFPFIASTGVYAFAGFIFIFIAVLLFIFGFSTPIESDDLKIDKENSQPTKKTFVKGGGVVLIGPIPIIFGSNWKIAVFLMILAIVLILVSFFTFRLL